MKLADLLDTHLLDDRIADGLVSAKRHPSLPLTIYNYTKKCQYDGAWDEITRKTRGLIVDDAGEIVARPWEKFHNYAEHDEGALDLSAAVRVTDKLDGSLGILYPTGDGWAIATRGSFTSDQAVWASDWFARYANCEFFKSDQTYLFEILAKWNRVVVDYDWEGLVLIGVRDTDTGRNLDLPDDPRVLQARVARDDAGEYVSPSEGMETVSSVQERELQARPGTPWRKEKSVSKGMGSEEQGSRARVSEDHLREGEGVSRQLQTEHSLHGLRGDVPAGGDGLRSHAWRQGVPGEQNPEHQDNEGRDRKVRSSLRELSPSANEEETPRFGVVAQFECATLADALLLPVRPNSEGVVVELWPHAETQGDMVKIKQDDYVALHRIITGLTERSVWEHLAVSACSLWITEPNHWASFVGIDPQRVEEILAAGPEWRVAIPEEFQGWIDETADRILETVRTHLAEAERLLLAAGSLDSPREQYELVREHPCAGEIMRLLKGGGDHGTLVQKTWRISKPEAANPIFAREEDVA